MKQYLSLSACAFLCLLLVNQANAAITANLDHTQIALGQTVMLTIKATDGDSIGQPDLSPLHQDFRVLGQSSSRNYQFINGHSSTSKRLKIRLMPKGPGKIIIPPLQTASGKTRQLILSVTNSAGQQQSGPATTKKLFVRASISPKTVYVGQQTTVTVKLYYAIPINNGSLANLSVDHASVRKLGKASRSKTRLNGRRYNVYKQKYAVIPAKPGKLSIPAVTFQGQTIRQSHNNFFRQFNMPGFNMKIPSFGTPVPVTAASQPMSLKVNPIPSGWSGRWLPARKLTLGASGIPANHQLTVGKPLNLHLSLSALGLPASSLPELTLPDIPGASVYADKPESHTTHSNNLLKGEKNRTFAILPQQPGKLTLPATSLTWFNTRTGKKETVNLPSETFTVVAVSGQSQSATTGKTPGKNPGPHTTQQTTSKPTTPSTGTAHESTALVKGFSFWQIAFAASLLLWLLVIILLVIIWRRRPSVSPDTPVSRKSPADGNRRLFFEQIANKDKQLLSTLLAWARTERPDVNTLPSLKMTLAKEQSILLEQIEAWRYGNGDFPAGLATAFKGGLEWREKAREPTPLDPLYPDH